MTTPPPIVAFAAPSGTGKTTFLETLIRELVGRGLKVAAIKHDAHSFQVDRPGKDTHRFRSAGASRVAISNDRELAVMGETDPGLTPEQLTARYLGDVDIVVVEGFREAVDDVRYGTTLKLAIAAAKEADDEGRRKLAAAADRFLAEFDVTGDLDAVRRRIIEYILQLRDLEGAG